MITPLIFLYSLQNMAKLWPALSDYASDNHCLEFLPPISPFTESFIFCN